MTAPPPSSAAARWRRLLALGVALGLALGLAVPPPAAPADGHYRLVGLAPLSDGSLVLLDDALGLFVVSPQNRTMRNLGFKLGLNVPSDITTYRSARGDHIFVTMRLRSSTSQGVVGGRLLRFGVDGKVTGEWLAGPALALSGIAITPDGRTAYLTSRVQPEVYRMDLSRLRSTPYLVTTARRAETLGALVLDSKRRRLLAADSYLGTVNEVSVDGSRSRIFLESFDEPAALALDAARDRLFVADAGEDRIFVVDLAAEKPKARTFAVVKGLEDPHSLAVGVDGSVWAASYRSPTLFRLSPAGALVESFQPKPIAAPVRR